MKRKIYFWIMFCFLFLLMMCTKVEATTNMLFIGNSKTYYNNFATIFSKLVEASKVDDVNFKVVTTGGKTLEWNYNHSIKNNASILDAKWDYVILQEQTDVAQNDLSTLQTKFNNGYLNHFEQEDIKSTSVGAKHIVNSLKIKNPNIKVVYNAVWPRATDTEYVQKLINLNFENVKNKLGGKISFSGSAFLKSMKKYPDIQLYMSDKLHPTVAGSYLSACTLFATIYNRTPEGINYYGGIDINQDQFTSRWKKSHNDLDADTAKKLQKIATDTMNIKSLKLVVDNAPGISRRVENNKFILTIKDSSGIEEKDIKIYRLNEKNVKEELTDKKLITHKVLNTSSKGNIEYEYTLTKNSIKLGANYFFLSATDKNGEKTEIYFMVKNKDNKSIGSNFAPNFSTWVLRSNNQVSFKVSNGGNIKNVEVYDLNNNNQKIVAKSNLETGEIIVLNLKKLKADANGNYRLRLYGEDLQSLSRTKILAFNTKEIK